MRGVPPPPLTRPPHSDEHGKDCELVNAPVAGACACDVCVQVARNDSVECCGVGNVNVHWVIRLDCICVGLGQLGRTVWRNGEVHVIVQFRSRSAMLNLGNLGALLHAKTDSKGRLAWYVWRL